MVDGYETRKLHSSYPGFNAKPQNLKLRYFCVEILALRSYSVMLVFTLIILWNGSRSNDSFECGRVHQLLHQLHQLLHQLHQHRAPGGIQFQFSPLT